MGEAILWCLFSLAVFWMDRETEEHGGAHMAWHLLTGVGVGRMVSGVAYDTT